MKPPFYLLILLILLSCNSENLNKKNGTEISTTSETVIESKEKKENQIKPEGKQKNAKNENDIRLKTLEEEFSHAMLFELTDTVKSDLNGDGELEIITFEKIEKNSGIIIQQPKTGEKIRIGFGNAFEHMNNFNWVDFWGIVKDSVTYEVVIKDSEIIGDRTVSLEFPSIVLRKNDEGGGLITFKNGIYIWIHQAD